MKLSALIRQELEKRGIRTVREAAQFLRVSSETVRLMLNRGRIPKDRVLVAIANKLEIDPAVLLLTAHRERLPRTMQSYFLMPAPPARGDWARKRRWPLSQEQCEYLGRIMTGQEIQLLRMYRQLTPERMQEAVGFMTYLFELCRSKQAA
jgi:transcriptional regulator with XRE-family HTH domain